MLLKTEYFYLLLLLSGCSKYSLFKTKIVCDDVFDKTSSFIEYNFDKIKNECFGEKPDDYLTSITTQHDEEYVNCFSSNSTKTCKILLGQKYWSEKDDRDESWDLNNHYDLNLKHIVSVSGKVTSLTYKNDVHKAGKNEVLNFIYDNSLSFKVMSNEKVVSFYHEGNSQEILYDDGRKVSIEKVIVTDIKNNKSETLKAIGFCKFYNPNIKNAAIKCAANVGDTLYSFDFVGDGDKQIVYERPMEAYRKMPLSSGKSCSNFYNIMHEFSFGSTKDYDLFEYFRKNCIDTSKNKAESVTRKKYFSIVKNNCNTPYYAQEGTMYTSMRWKCHLDAEFTFYPKYDQGIEIKELEYAKLNPAKWFKSVKVKSNTGVKLEKVGKAGQEKIIFKKESMEGSLTIELSGKLNKTYPLFVQVNGGQYRYINLIESFHTIQIDYIKEYVVFSWNISKSSKQYLIVDIANERARTITDTRDLKGIIGWNSFDLIQGVSGKKKSQKCSKEDNNYSEELSGVSGDDAFAFCEHLKRIIKNKDMNSFVENIHSELKYGPREKAFLMHKWDNVFSKKWMEKQLESDCDCRPVGWRGFNFGNIWYQVSKKGFEVFSILDINEIEDEIYEKWFFNKNEIPSGCFSYPWYSGDNFEYISEKYNINYEDLTTKIGNYLGKQLKNFKSENPWSGDDAPVFLFGDVKSCNVKEEVQPTVKIKLPIDICRELSPNLEVKIISCNGVVINERLGTMTHSVYGIYGLGNFEANEIKIFPLKFFDTFPELLDFKDEWGTRNKKGNK